MLVPRNVFRFSFLASSFLDRLLITKSDLTMMIWKTWKATKRTKAVGRIRGGPPHRAPLRLAFSATRTTSGGRAAPSRCALLRVVSLVRLWFIHKGAGGGGAALAHIDGKRRAGQRNP